MSEQPILELKNVHSGYGSIKALKGVPIKDIAVLGESGRVEWTETAEGASITLPAFENPTPGYALKVSL